MYLFEDDGGILPIHTTGLLVAGRDLTALHLGFDAMIGNGIGSTPISDNDSPKSVTLALHSQITHALKVGVNYYNDHIAQGTPRIYGAPVDVPLTPGDTVLAGTTQQMFGGYAAYFGSALELLGEYQRITHVPTAGGTTTATDAFYAYAGYRLGKFVPYARYDGLNFDPAGPYYVADNEQLVTVGARYDFAATAQLKVEYRHRETDLEGTVNEGVIQAAVAF
jgi:hypothetical protein